MPGQDVLDNGKPETGALLRPAGLHVDPVEAFGDARDMFLRDTRPKIGDGDGRFRTWPFAPDLDGYPSPGAAIFASVLNQVIEHLNQFVAVARHLDRHFRQVEIDGHTELGGQVRKRIAHFLEQAAQIDPLRRRPDR